ncbi:carboxypeptidase regulatory-like domain-containing protein [bacterium]|nr:carboxypeptidase regulatory-like domain-containing protein [bacterium]
MSKKSRICLSFKAAILISIISVIKLVGCASDSQPDFTVRGIVKDAITENPIAGAKVSDEKYGSEPRKSAITDSNGKYSYLTSYEEHTIIVQADGYKTQSRVLTTKFLGRENENTLDFVLVPE